MGIYIKGMEMPKSCVDCHDKGVCNHINALVYCPWCRDIIDPALYALSGKRHPDCPLVELPPHGRLIDADDVENITVIMNENGSGFNHIIAPTIIGAEEGE